jgi:hypothetical protein
MAQESPSACKRRETRVLLLREMLSSFQKAQRSIVLADLKGMEKHLTAQHQMCLALMALGDSLSEQISSDASAAERARWNNLTQDLQEMERRAHHLGRVQAALLRRSRRAQELMARLLATTAVTYSPPVIIQAAAAGK